MAVSNKSIILRAFNTNFFEFIDTVISFFPDLEDIKTMKTSAELLKKANPTTLIKGWLAHFYSPYAAAINDGNIDFFIEKDYNEEKHAIASNGLNAGEFVQFIDQLREPVRRMSPEQKSVVVSYVQNLSRFSVQYAL